MFFVSCVPLQKIPFFQTSCDFFFFARTSCDFICDFISKILRSEILLRTSAKYIDFQHLSGISRDSGKMITPTSTFCCESRYFSHGRLQPRRSPAARTGRRGARPRGRRRRVRHARAPLLQHLPAGNRTPPRHGHFQQGTPQTAKIVRFLKINYTSYTYPSKFEDSSKLHLAS